MGAAGPEGGEANHLRGGATARSGDGGGGGGAVGEGSAADGPSAGDTGSSGTDGGHGFAGAGAGAGAWGGHGAYPWVDPGLCNRCNVRCIRFHIEDEQDGVLPKESLPSVSFPTLSIL